MAATIPYTAGNPQAPGGNEASLKVNSTSGKMEFSLPDGSQHQVVSAATNATGASDMVMAKEVTFTASSAAGVWTGSVALPAGATLLDVIVNAVALWPSTTSATMIVGDADDPNGYYAGIDLKATDLLAGESISFALAGGKAGAYIANSQVSPRYAAAARSVIGEITTVGTTASGSTRMLVVYSLPVSVTAATKVAS